MKLEEIKACFLVTGKKVENNFVDVIRKTFKDVDFLKPNKHQDMIEHWDIGIITPNNKQILIDVKGLKKKNRNDNYYNDTEHWIEMKGITGYDGWVYGKSDYIAFECFEYWLLVDRKELAILAEELTKDGKIVYETYQARNNRYQRKKWGRLDECTIAYKEELLNLKHKKILK